MVAWRMCSMAGRRVDLPLYLLIAGSVLMLFIAAGRTASRSTSQGGHFLSNVTVSRLMNGPWLTNQPMQFLAIAFPVFSLRWCLSRLTCADRCRVSLDHHLRDCAHSDLVLSSCRALLCSWWGSTSERPSPLCLRGFTISIYVRRRNNPQWIFFVVVAVMVLLILRFDEQSRFQTTPLDYLMVFLAVTFPLLPEVRPIFRIWVSLPTKLIVLFFSFELLLHAFRTVCDSLVCFTLDPVRTRNSDFVVEEQVT